MIKRNITDSKERRHAIVYQLIPDSFSEDGGMDGVDEKTDYLKSMGVSEVITGPDQEAGDLGKMNYELRDILLDYINYTISAGEAAEGLKNSRDDMAGMLNILGGSGTDRILTLMACEEDYWSAVRKVMLLSVLQYALPGVPCIFYGDEAGLTGSAPYDNVKKFPWGNEIAELCHHYRMLGLLYDEHPALADGDFEMLSGLNGISDDVFAFTRSGKDAAGTEETLLVLANRRYGDCDVDLRSFGQLKGAYALELLESEEIETDVEGSLGIIHMDRLSVKLISIRKEKPHSEGFGRKAGVICHISSLGTPVLGKPARDFVDYLASAGFSIWQVLPLNPAGAGDSPYSSYAAFAGDTRFINADELPDDDTYEQFTADNSFWLNSYAAYTVIKESMEMKPWYEWPDEYKFADPEEYLKSLDGAEKDRAEELFREQYLFYMQWKDLHEYASSKGVSLMGDLPIYMAADSADVWADKKTFIMDDLGNQRVHAGVPPDAFTDFGQDWGNPLYDWEKLKSSGYDWWIKRILQCAERFDILRIDHFRGLSEYWAIPDGGVPKDGCWQHGPGLSFIAAMRDALDREGRSMKLLAEDLGYLDSGVRNLMKLTGLPGMDIWQFTADEMMEMCEREPERAANRAFYTGTHDNDTLCGWIDPQQGSDGANKPDEDGAEAEAAAKPVSEATKERAKEIIKMIYGSPAALAILQLQDVFMLGSDARMNVPGVPEGNWSWKLPGASVHEAFPDADETAVWFRELAISAGR